MTELQRNYRSYVGPAEDYDIIGALQVALLFAAGLRQHHKLLDVGCGSLRAGRMLIPYLNPENYYGLEPNRWLIDEGLNKELSLGIMNTKKPKFYWFNNFVIDTLGTKFDFILAQSIFSHTFPNLMKHIFERTALSLNNHGRLLATFCQHGSPPKGKGWLYPGAVAFTWQQVLEQMAETGLVARRLIWFHPRQVWFVAGLESDVKGVEVLAVMLNNSSPKFRAYGNKKP